VTGERIRLEDRRSRPADAWAACWTLAAAIAMFTFYSDLHAIRWHGDHSIMGVALWGRDFVNVYTSGTLVLNHHLDILYDVNAYRSYQLDLFQQSLKYHNYSYPPVTLLYTWLFALVPYPVAYVAWLGGTGAFFTWAARPYLKGAGLPVWMALAAPASIINMWAGHYGFLVGGLWLAAFHYLPKRPWLAGVLIGCIIVKPHLAVLAPFVLLWRGEWRAVVAASATSIGLVLASILVFGPDLWEVYLTRTATLQVGMVDDLGAFYILMMPTLMPSLAILHVGTFAAAIAQGIVAVAVIALLLWKMPKDSKQAGLATATATFLVLPYAFTYDMTVVGIAAMLLFHKGRDRGPILYNFGAGAAFLLPMISLFLNMFRIPIAPPVLVFQLCALLGLVRPNDRTEAETEAEAEAQAEAEARTA
jgi:alpha-1,2-mannosyltransferase